MKTDLAAIHGMKVTVMGLGIHGGGLASALFFARRGARVTVTDLRSAEVLRNPSRSCASIPSVTCWKNTKRRISQGPTS